MASTCGGFQNPRWTKLESTLKIIRTGIENASIGYNLTSEIWVSEGPRLATGGHSDFQIMSPGGECFALLWRMSLISARNKNLRWTQLESTPKFIIMEIESSSFGFYLTFETLLIWEHEKSNTNQQKSRILKMNPDTYGHFLGYQESPGIVFDTTRLHKTRFQ